MRKSLILVLMLFLTIHTHAQEETNPFGVVEGFWFPELSCELGVGWERIIFDWAQHQPEGPEDWHTLNVDDRWLKAANRCDREVVALLKNTPAWATTGQIGSGVPSGLYLPVDDPNNHWANFVRQSARYYASRGVHRFIIWNEPDIDPDTYGFEFEGTLEDYFMLLKVAYLAAKEGNPAAEIHLAGTTYWHNINNAERLYLDALLERIAADPVAAENGYYFDVASLHIYFRTDSVYEIVREMRQLLDQHGMTDQAIWINETNAPPTQDPQWPVDRPVFKYTLEQQAAFMVQAAVLARAAGADRIAVYKLYDQELPPGGETFGILRPDDQSKRPAFDAWHTVNVLFAEAVEAQRVQTDTADLVWLHNRDGSQLVVAWARTDAPVIMQVRGDGAIYDYLNASAPQSSFESEVDLTLAGATCNGDDPLIPCPVGGAPVIVTLANEPVTVQILGDNGTIAPLIENGEVVDE